MPPERIGGQISRLSLVRFNAVLDKRARPGGPSLWGIVAWKGCRDEPKGCNPSDAHRHPKAAMGDGRGLGGHESRPGDPGSIGERRGDVGTGVAAVKIR
jgi:hypothetical protein